MKHSIYKRLLTGSFSFLALLVCVSSVGAQSVSPSVSSDPVLRALEGYHFNKSASELEQIAGGQEQLVSRLLELRGSEKPPFVGIRAVKVLMSYGEREDVRSALLEDMRSASRLGVARTLVVHIDSVSNRDFRYELARQAVERAVEEESFSRYARALEDSSDERVRRIALRQE